MAEALRRGAAPCVRRTGKMEVDRIFCNFVPHSVIYGALSV
jgi:hypothetical protein